MSETDTDRRGYRLLAVGHSLLNPLSQIPGNLEVTAVFLSWINSLDAGIYQLPLPSYLFPGSRDPRLEDSENLEFVFEQLHLYVANGYEFDGLVLSRFELAAPGGADWLTDLVASADRVGVSLPPLFLALSAEQAGGDGSRAPREVSLAELFDVASEIHR